ncbi:hypothetical protein PLICRDRAFT_502918 [Plicaturopsis crispa FD-325 SS-3]|nr:hypothetical protein PLICRDRAFT_502918 [Plicaturopsis crispa FD-325 SS-3]
MSAILSGLCFRHLYASLRTLRVLTLDNSILSYPIAVRFTCVLPLASSASHPPRSLHLRKIHRGGRFRGTYIQCIRPRGLNVARNAHQKFLRVHPSCCA